MGARLWNIGVKVGDVEAEAAFFVALGGRLLVRERATTAVGEIEYALVEFGGTRLLLTPTPVFQDRLAAPPPDGLTHAVFEVDDLDAEVRRLATLGTEVLILPVEISAGFGTRRIAFFRSPGGLVFEVMQIIESLV